MNIHRSRWRWIYMLAYLHCVKRLYLPLKDGNLPPVQLLHHNSNTMLRIRYVTVFFVTGEIAAGPWINGKSVSSVVFKNTWMYKSTPQYASTYFNYCRTGKLWHSRARILNSGRFISLYQELLALKMIVITSCTIQA